MLTDLWCLIVQWCMRHRMREGFRYCRLSTAIRTYWCFLLLLASLGLRKKPQVADVPKVEMRRMQKLPDVHVLADRVNSVCVVMRGQLYLRVYWVTGPYLTIFKSHHVWPVYSGRNVQWCDFTCAWIHASLFYLLLSIVIALEHAECWCWWSRKPDPESPKFVRKMLCC